MLKYIALIAVGLLSVDRVMAYSIPEYDQCIDLCADDPSEEDPTKVAEMDACCEKCNEDEKNRCLSKHPHNFGGRQKCVTSARQRCIRRCGEEATCIFDCQFKYQRLDAGIDM
ncbi:hypothetical protein CRM22_006973 [Opisthorchis felineus]|uniref:TIL domain-containing protein n=1 Tax=Opisthorchis felineus TaxID=147828 RepID=A0A4S2LKA8_OPIFE|nr:hypothetical protein CRM22_006973 [Opisthorchis felineus]